MSTLIANLPPKKVWVDKSYLTAGEEGGWREDGSGWYFRSQSEARAHGFVQANISRAIAGERPRANGYYWSEF